MQSNPTKASDGPCRFCTLVAAPELAMTERPIVLTGGVAVASVGAIVPGWTLVVGSQHETSAARLNLTSRESLFCAAEHVRRALSRSTSDPVYILEHGACCSSSAAACTTAHVHLHVVPVPHDLLVHAQRRFPLPGKWSTTTLDALGDIWRSDYLLASAREGEIVVNHLVEPVSQYFRRVLADMVGCSSQWNWREWPHLERIRETQLLLTRLLVNPDGAAA